MFKKLPKLLALFIAIVVSNAALIAQNGTIEGTVSDDLGPLFGAAVLIKGETAGTITDFDGQYTLSAPAGKHLVEVSYIGYNSTSQTVSVKPGETVTLDFTLLEGIGLDEVIVVGSRSEGRTKLNSAVPVDVINRDVVG